MVSDRCFLSAFRLADADQSINNQGSACVHAHAIAAWCVHSFTRGVQTSNLLAETSASWKWGCNDKNELFDYSVVFTLVLV